MDALDYYIAAVSDLKSDHDYLWLASAYDGYAATTLALLQYRYNLDEVLGTRDVRLSSAYLNSGQSSAATNSATNSAPNSAAKDNGINQSTSNYTIFSSRTADGFNSEDAERVIAIAEDRANSAILIYSRSIVLCTLEVESILRLARMHELINYTQEKEEKVLLQTLLKQLLLYLWIIASIYVGFNVRLESCFCTWAQFTTANRVFVGRGFNLPSSWHD